MRCATEAGPPPPSTRRPEARQPVYDAIVVGGGFYGATVAAYLVRRRGLKRVLLVECEAGLLQRASFNNQARVHNGYHYPRSFTTAYRSRINLRRFAQDFPQAVRHDYTALYAIARRSSKVTASQFERFCLDIGARLQPASAPLRALFDARLIERVYMVEEPVFDARMLARRAVHELAVAGVEVRLDTRVVTIDASTAGMSLVLRNELTHEDAGSVAARHVFNCAYSGLNAIAGDFKGSAVPLKHEITELVLIDPPRDLRGIGITIMDGPFFSTLPHPASQLHSLSHVRYTPHLAWEDLGGADPYTKLREYRRESRVDRMLRDAARYVPAMADAVPVQSLFEVKTVLGKNEIDDGRPILFERDAHLPGLYLILGGKIDNIYDVLERLDAEAL